MRTLRDTLNGWHSVGGLPSGFVTLSSRLTQKAVASQRMQPSFQTHVGHKDLLRRSRRGQSIREFFFLGLSQSAIEVTDDEFLDDIMIGGFVSHHAPSASRIRR